MSAHKKFKTLDEKPVDKGVPSPTKVDEILRDPETPKPYDVLFRQIYTTDSRAYFDQTRTMIRQGFVSNETLEELLGFEFEVNEKCMRKLRHSEYVSPPVTTLDMMDKEQHESMRALAFFICMDFGEARFWDGGTCRELFDIYDSIKIGRGTYSNYNLAPLCLLLKQCQESGQDPSIFGMVPEKIYDLYKEGSFRGTLEESVAEIDDPTCVLENFSWMYTQITSFYYLHERHRDAREVVNERRSNRRDLFKKLTSALIAFVVTVGTIMRNSGKEIEEGLLNVFPVENTAKKVKWYLFQY